MAANSAKDLKSSNNFLFLEAKDSQASSVKGVASRICHDTRTCTTIPVGRQFLRTRKIGGYSPDSIIVKQRHKWFTRDSATPYHDV